MSWNGAGTFTRSDGSAGCVNEQAAGEGIVASVFDTRLNDLATGINTCVTKDGQVAATANLPMGGFLHTGVGNATARTTYAAAGQVQDCALIYGGTSGGAANVQTVTLSPAITAYATGEIIAFKAGFTNTGSCTMNANGVGAVTIFDSRTLISLVGWEIVTGSTYLLQYNGANLLLLNPSTRAIDAGWNDLAETFTYASATTITITTGGASRFNVGDKIRFKQGAGYLYFYVITVADTVLTVTGGTDYTVANAVITVPSVSHAASPLGFPEWFNYTSTFGGFSGTPSSIIARFKVNGRQCTTYIRMTVGGSLTSNAITFTATAPITAATLTNANWGTTFYKGIDNSGNLTAAGNVIIASNSATITLFKDIASATWTNVNNKAADFILTYEI